MRFCEECGAQLEDNAKFCEECGAEQEPIITERISEKAIEETVTEMERKSSDEVQKTSATEDNSEYGFCEECGARIKLTDMFCEACGTANGQTEQTQAGVKVQEKTVVKASEEPVRKKGIRFIWIPVAIVLLAAVMAGGYFFGKISSTKQNPVQIADKNAVPTPESTEVPVVTATPTVTPTVTPSDAPKSELVGKSIFEGYRAGEHIGSKIRMNGPNGVSLFFNSTAKPLANGYITDGEHYLEFEFRAGNVIFYPDYFNGDNIVLVKGDVLRIDLSEGGAYVYWGHVQDEQAEVYYKGNVSMSDAECIGEYTRLLSNSLKHFESSDKVVSTNPFQKVSDGTVLEVAYSGDDKEKLGFGFAYNHELDTLRMEIYCYEEDAYLYGYVKGQIYYEEDTVYYLAPVYEDDGVYWDEIPYEVIDGEKQYDLSGYDVYCEVRMNVSENGISLYWSAHEDGVERVFYNDFFDSKHMQRKAYVKHY